MILLPIGHEEAGVRRLPWVTFGVMSACAIAFLLTGRAHLYAGDDVQLTRDLMEAVEYYVEHPYLELDPQFEELLLDDGEDELLAYLDEIYDGAVPTGPGDGGRVESEQQVLDRLTREALASRVEHPLFRWGLVPADISAIALLTHMFLHAGWLHLLGNMLILYLAGPFIEDVWGRPLYLGFYVAAGLFAALAHIGSAAGSTIPMIGASGAIAGVMGAFLVRYRDTRIRFFYMVGIFIRGTFAAPAWIMLPLWFAQQLFFALLTADMEQGGGVAYMAHVGGFVFGVGAAVALAAGRVEERWLNESIESKISNTVLQNHAVERAMTEHARGNAEQALDLLATETRRCPGNVDAAVAHWSLARELGREAEATPSLCRAIREELRRGENDLALQHWSELQEHVPRAEVDTGLLVRLAPALVHADRRDEARVVLRRALLAAGTRITAVLALRLARAAAPLEPAVGRGALRLALAQPDLEPHERGRLEEALARLDGPVLSPQSGEPAPPTDGALPLVRR